MKSKNRYDKYRFFGVIIDDRRCDWNEAKRAKKSLILQAEYLLLSAIYVTVLKA